MCVFRSVCVCACVTCVSVWCMCVHAHLSVCMYACLHACLCLCVCVHFNIMEIMETLAVVFYFLSLSPTIFSLFCLDWR